MRRLALPLLCCLVGLVFPLLPGSAQAAKLDYWPGHVPPDWVKLQGGAALEDKIAGAALDPTGNLVVAGTVDGVQLTDAPYGTNQDILIAKFQPNGTPLWGLRLDLGPAEEGCGLGLDGAGNGYVAGTRSTLHLGGTGATTYPTAQSIFLSKCSAVGAHVWTADYVEDGNLCVAKALAVDSSGNAYITGTAFDWLSGTNVLTLKFSPAGSLLWARAYPQGATPHQVAVDAQGNVVVAAVLGEHWPWLGRGFLLLKYAPDGTLLWAASYSEPQSSYDQLAGLALDAQGNAFLAGASSRTEGYSYVGLLVKCTSAGDLAWARAYGGPTPQDPYNSAQFNALALDPAGNVVVVGNNDGALVCQYAPDGTLRWSHQGWGLGISEAYLPSGEFMAVGVDAAGDIYAAAEVGYAYTAKFDSQGTLLWASPEEGPDGRITAPSAVCVAGPNRFYVAGTSYQPGSLIWQQQDWFLERFVQTPPTLGSLPDVTTPEDTPLSVPLSLSDAQTPSEALSVVITCSNTNLFPLTNLVVSNTATAPTLTLTPAPQSSGSARITVLVSDGEFAVSNSFTAVVTPVDDPPRVSSLASQFTWADRPVLVPFTVSDLDTPLSQLSVSCVSSNTSLLPASGLALSGSGSNWLMVVRPAPAQSGVGVVGIVVSDGTSTTVTPVSVTVNARNHFPVAGSLVSTSAVRLAWSQTYANPGLDDPVAVKVDKALNVVVVGRTWQWNQDDYLLLKYAPDGAELWRVWFNGPEKGIDVPSAMALDEAGNIYVTGWSYQAATSYDFVTVKYSPDGQPLWTARYDGPANGEDRPVALAVDRAGRVFVTGSSYGGINSLDDFATVAYSAAGALLWSARYGAGAGSYDYPTALVPDGSGGAHVTGYSTCAPYTNTDIVTVSYPSSGRGGMARGYDGPAHGYDIPAAIALIAPGTLVVAGQSADASGAADLVVLRYSSDPWPAWVARYDGPAHRDDAAQALAVDAFGDIFVTGYSQGASYSDIVTLRYSRQGQPLWAARYADPAATWCEGLGLQVDPVGNVYVGGLCQTFSGYETATLKYSPTGQALWSATYPAYAANLVMGLALDDLGDVYVTAGTQSGWPADNDIVTLKYTQADYAQAAATSEDTLLNLTLLGSDVDADPLTYQIVRPPEHGTLSGSGPNWVYTPATNFNGADAFVFKVNDGTNDSPEATCAIAIAPVNDPPLVDWLTPTNGSLLMAGSSVVLSAGASDVDGSVAQVEFYANTNLVGTRFWRPYSVVWSNVPAGVYSLTAVATDTAGARTVSTPVLCTVEPPLQLTLTGPVTAGRFQLSLGGPVGRRVAVQASADLIHWETIGNAVLAEAPVSFAAPTAELPRRFYRLVNE